MDLVLIRHPAVDVPPGVCYGQTDLALKAAPTQAVASIASHCRARGPIVACFTSPLQRCAVVAQALVHSSSDIRAPLAAQGVEQARLSGPPVVDERLAEIDFGHWEMQRWDDIPRQQIDDWAANVLDARPHHGESAQMVADRCASWLLDLSLEIDSGTDLTAPLGGNDAPEPCVLVIGHAGPIRLLTALALDLPLTAALQWPLDFGGVVTLKREVASHAARPFRSASTRSPSGSSAHWTLRQWNG